MCKIFSAGCNEKKRMSPPPLFLENAVLQYVLEKRRLNTGASGGSGSKQFSSVSSNSHTVLLSQPAGSYRRTPAYTRCVRRRAIRHRAAREQFHGVLYLTRGKTLPGSCILRNRREICRKPENITPAIAGRTLYSQFPDAPISRIRAPDFGRNKQREESNCLLVYGTFLDVAK